MITEPTPVTITPEAEIPTPIPSPPQQTMICVKYNASIQNEFVTCKDCKLTAHAECVRLTRNTKNWYCLACKEAKQLQQGAKSKKTTKIIAPHTNTQNQNTAKQFSQMKELSNYYEFNHQNQALNPSIPTTYHYDTRTNHRNSSHSNASSCRTQLSLQRLEEQKKLDLELTEEEITRMKHIEITSLKRQMRAKEEVQRKYLDSKYALLDDQSELSTSDCRLPIDNQNHIKNWVNTTFIEQPGLKNTAITSTELRPNKFKPQNSI